MTLRSPIVSVLGHVDHGKSSILDTIRGSNIVAGEAGAITQAIGVSIIPLETIAKRLKKLYDASATKLSIPGLLFIDTPGHAAFTSLRSRGGSLADIAILVVDITEGCKPQTYEAIEILKNAKTPFIIAANKLDLVPGFVPVSSKTLIQHITSQKEQVVSLIDQKVYELVGVLHERFSLQSERFDRVNDYTQQVAIVPCSAKTGLGLEEVLLVLVGLAQKYLEESLSLDVSGPARGIILEVKEQKGLGSTLDAIFYDGTLKVGDTVVYGTLDKPKSTKVRALFEPAANTDLRDKKAKYRSVKQVMAATGVRIGASDLSGAVSGMPIWACEPSEIEDVCKEFSEYVQSVQIQTEQEGVVIKADTLGSLEAMIHLLKQKKIPIRKASVGPISKKDIVDAQSNVEKHPLYAAILGFNIPVVESTDRVHVIVDEVIYRLLERFEEWQEQMRVQQQAKELEGVMRPCKIEVLQNCIFRLSNPCIVGVEVLKGELRTGMALMNAQGETMSIVKSIQADKESVKSASRGRQVALSLPKVTAGKQVCELDFLYSALSEEDFRKLKKLIVHLSGDEKEALREVADIKRKINPVWGV